jgi:hypothetical protein
MPTNKIPVDGATGLITLYMLPFMGWPDTAAPRADCLAALNYAERYIANRGSLLYLRRQWSLTMNPGQFIAVPISTATPAVDLGKDLVIEDENGVPLEYCSPDELAGRAAASYDRVSTGPAAFTVVMDSVDEAMKFKFRPVLAVGAPARTYTLIGQRAVIALTDSGSSSSLLPEGYEVTLLVPVAECYLKQRKHEIDAPLLDSQTQRELDAFTEGQRANKKHATTDGNLQRRKAEEVQMDPGV